MTALPSTALHSSARHASAAGGQILRAATKAITAARATAKPLHPYGFVVNGVLQRYGAQEQTGAEWLDETGEDVVLVRRSRAVGVPAPTPDIFGLALRVPTPGGRYGDLLFASTGLGRLTRFTLTAARSPYTRPLTTLLPYRTPAGPLLVSAVYRNETTVDLSWAVRTGSWHRFAELQLPDDADGPGSDAPVSFDPVLNTLPGLVTYGWVRRLREPSYRTARRSRTTQVSRQADREPVPDPVLGKQREHLAEDL